MEFLKAGPSQAQRHGKNPVAGGEDVGEEGQFFKPC